MGLLTAALVVGAGAAAMGAVGAAKSRKQQEAAMARQETQARESNRVDQTRPDGGADIVLGTDEDKGGARRSTAQRSNVRGKKATTTAFGGAVSPGMAAMAAPSANSSSAPKPFSVNTSRDR